MDRCRSGSEVVAVAAAAGCGIHRTPERRGHQPLGQAVGANERRRRLELMEGLCRRRTVSPRGVDGAGDQSEPAATAASFLSSTLRAIIALNKIRHLRMARRGSPFSFASTHAAGMQFCNDNRMTPQRSEQSVLQSDQLSRVPSRRAQGVLTPGRQRNPRPPSKTCSSAARDASARHPIAGPSPATPGTRGPATENAGRCAPMAWKPVERSRLTFPSSPKRIPPNEAPVPLTRCPRFRAPRLARRIGLR